MVYYFLKFSSLRHISILKEPFVKFCYMTPSMVGLLQNVSLAKGSFRGPNGFYSNGTTTDLCIYSSSTKMNATLLERKH